MDNSPLIRPAIYWGGSFGGGTLGSHEDAGMIGMILWKKLFAFEVCRISLQNSAE